MKKDSYPKIHLAIDNCFASKRWTNPLEWGQVVADLGLRYVEASADTECDPLYGTADFLQHWVDELHELQSRHGVRVANLYSGHGTYATLGLAHTDKSIRDHIHHDWLEPMIDRAAELGAGLGFFCHAFSQAILNSREAYKEACTDLLQRLAELAAYAAERDVTAGVEQMYTPHQIPWTLNGARDMLRTVAAKSDSPFYITIDTGHQIGQRRFLQPAEGRVHEAWRRRRHGWDDHSLWLGSSKAHELFTNSICSDTDNLAEQLTAIQEDMAANPQLFASYEDGDLHAWLERLGCWSPIIHLQQTDGSSSAHRPFTAAYNKTGIVHGPQVLQALATACRQPIDPGMPPRCRDIYLTLEIFSGTADLPSEIVDRLQKSVAYWRQYVPEDGLPLDQLLDR